jgi:cyclopropane fatty-acyl-phospholipid synthase-like methyltransferase
LLVPRKDELLDTIVDLVPFDQDREFCAVDVGAGQGALSERVLRRFRRAHVVLLDASAEMLAVAERRLAPYAPRFSVVVGDFNDPGWYAPIAHPVSAIVSAIALHYLRTECRAPFFRAAYDLLEAPGYFANGGAFDTEDPFIQGYCTDKHIAYTQQLLELEGRQVPLEKLRERRAVEAAKAGINRMRFKEQAELLRDTGFEHVEMVWRYLPIAVFVAYKEAP